DDSEPVAQPLYGCSRDEDGALECISGGLPVQFPGDCCQQPRRQARRVTNVGKQEAAGAVCALGHALLKATLPKECSLLIAEIRQYGSRKTYKILGGSAEVGI